MHQSVLLEETVEWLGVRSDGVYVDGTLGSGGHAEAVLMRLGANGRLFGIDRDAAALRRSQSRLAGFGDRFRAIHGNYAEMGCLIRACGVEQVDGIIMDFGVSSEQLDTAGRGFSFMQDGPLDMRMDQAQALTAADIVNRYSQAELSGLLWHLGEEREARRISQRIIAAREKQAIETTCQLAALIETAKGGRRGKRQHPATKSFQALRMAVNGELEGIDRGLHEGLQLLKDGGRMAVISFHSLEDRRVKHFFRDHEGCWVAQQSGGEQWQGVLPAVKRLTRKAVKPSATECAENVRARSSRLRVAERLASPHQDRS